MIPNTDEIVVDVELFTPTGETVLLSSVISRTTLLIFLRHLA